MAARTEILQFIEVLNTDPNGTVIISHLIQAISLGLIPESAVTRFLEDATNEWLLLKGAQADWQEVGDVAVECARYVAGSSRGFPSVTSPPDGNETSSAAKRSFAFEALSSTHFICMDFESIAAFHLDFARIRSGLTSSHESCSPGEFSTETSKLLDDVQRRSAAGENLVFAGASLGAPNRALWSTPTVIHSLDHSGTPIANHLRNRLGLVDLSWEQGRALFQYSIDTKHLGPGYRATPIEGGNSRFRLQPRKPKVFAPLGATVDLELLEKSLLNGGRVDEDGVAECVTAPFEPGLTLWNDLIRDLRFAGALSHSEDLPQSRDMDFRDLILTNQTPSELVPVIAQLFDEAADPVPPGP